MYAIREIFPHLSESSARAFFPFRLFFINAFPHHRYSSLGHFKKQLSLRDSQSHRGPCTSINIHFMQVFGMTRRGKKKGGGKKPLCFSNVGRRQPASSSFWEDIDPCDVFWAVHRLSVRLLMNGRKDARVQTGS